MRKRFWIIPLLALSALTLTDAPGKAYTQTVLHAFCHLSACADGEFPVAPVVQDSSGRLYGTTRSGGANNSGVVFRYNPATGNVAALYDFCSVGGSTCTDGLDPEGGLIIDTSGNLYGTTSEGGAHGDGEVFELKKPVSGGGGWTLQVLYSFCTTFFCPDGAQPNTKLTYAGANSGNPYDGTSLLFGTTADFSSQFFSIPGVVYALQNSSGVWSEKVIHTFGTDGQNPDGTLYTDGSGNMWGATTTGGSGGKGIAYKLTHGADLWNDPWTETILYNFCWAGGSCADGNLPGGLMLRTGAGGAPNVYGTTSEGGSANEGTVFKLTNGSCTEGGTATFWCETVLHNFCSVSGCADGSFPSYGGNVVLDSAGNIFGVTELGGSAASNGGVVYEVSGTTETVLYDFCPGGSPCTDGVEPVASLLRDASGNLFGVTAFGGNSNNAGVLFELTP